jgi:hypothetical protein
MTTFCLLHSSGQGPEGWKLVRDALEARHHRVLTPAFSIEETDKGAAWHAQTIVEQLRNSQCEPSTFVCVGHSAAGIFLPIIADLWKPRHMVFLVALIPRPGVSILDQFRADPSMFQPAWIGKDPMNDDVALQFLYHDCPRDRIAWVLSTRVRFYAKRAMEEPCPLVTWPAVPASYILASDDRTINPVWQRKASHEWLGVDAIELPGGHCPNVSRPEILADTLERCTD